MKIVARLCLLISIATYVSCGPGPKPPGTSSDGGTTPATGEENGGGELTDSGITPEPDTGDAGDEPIDSVTKPEPDTGDAGGEATGTAAAPAGNTFGDDLAFLKEHTEVTVLSDEAGQAKVAVVAAMQGRVMTSTAAGDDGLSFGWINRELIASGEVQPHINVFGGEDRFWIGPEGGQFSIFFAKGAEFTPEQWFTPAPIDTEPFELAESDGSRAVFKQDMQLTNYSDTIFDLRVDREVRLLSPDETVKALAVRPASDVKMVAFETINKMTNTGRKPWEKETGLLSIWILGMLAPSEAVTVVVPYVEGPEEDLGPIVNDAYFGTVPSHRLVVKDGTIYFSGDGRHRSKIGLTPQRSKPVLGSYDSVGNVLTVVQYNKPEGAVDYVNSMWELQKNPYSGDTVNSYNDGPMAPDKKPLGPFYELETSSPAAALGPGETITHIHRTIHLQGKEQDLSEVAERVLGVTVAQINDGLPR
jgi:hypothetical protein